MNSIKKHLGNIVLGLAVVAVLAFSGMQMAHELRDAHPVSALTTQSIKTFTGSINTETTVCTGTASTATHIYSMDIESSGAGVVVFKDGTGGTTILNVYVAATTPRQLTDLFGQNGLVLTQNVLTATLSGATLTASFRISNEPL